MVVGPPGTGKTDTAVQIMHVLYHNCPGQRTLLITHSNQALNDLFQKIMERDVPARYLLRLGACCCVFKEDRRKGDGAWKVLRPHMLACRPGMCFTWLGLKACPGWGCACMSKWLTSIKF
eukprot:scaffold309793_cov20-Tisochrysis_lutea.AAC.1